MPQTISNERMATQHLTLTFLRFSSNKEIKHSLADGTGFVDIKLRM